MTDKQYITAQQLLDDSFQLGLQVLDSDFKPNYIVGVWRGGTPVGIAVQELLDYFGICSDHIAIRTSFYEGIDKRASEVRVHGLNYILKRVKAEDSLLIVDDVYDTGLSVRQIILELQSALGDETPEIRIATPYFKPRNNKTDRKPDYYLHETDRWLVFPHELAGLDIEEILADKPGVSAIKARLLKGANSES